ncbi:MAG: hypothetical protein SF182_16250 [Deltaproteobacteria bacterium]|nr:hypothetical protein [Deltaproteobacteria bacterium]
MARQRSQVEATPATRPRVPRAPRAPRKRRRPTPRARLRQRSRVVALLVVGLFVAGLAVMALFQVTRPTEPQPFRFPTPQAAAPGSAAAGGVAPPAR